MWRLTAVWSAVEREVALCHGPLYPLSLPHSDWAIVSYRARWAKNGRPLHTQPAALIGYNKVIWERYGGHKGVNDRTEGHCFPLPPLGPIQRHSQHVLHLIWRSIIQTPFAICLRHGKAMPHTLSIKNHMCEIIIWSGRIQRHLMKLLNVTLCKCLKEELERPYGARQMTVDNANTQTLELFLSSNR